MEEKEVILEHDEIALLKEIEKGEWKEVPLTEDEKIIYQQSAEYTKRLRVID